MNERIQEIERRYEEISSLLADPSVIGRILRIEGAPVTIVGVAPPGHRGTIDIGLGTDFWLPLTALPQIAADPALRDSPTVFAPLLVKGRMRDGVSVAQVQAAMDVLAQRLAAGNPEQFRRAGEFALGPGITVVPSSDVRIHPQADTAIMALASVPLIYVMTEGQAQPALLSRLGKHKAGKACLYFKQLADLEEAVLEDLVVGSVSELRRRYGKNAGTS